MLVYNSTIAAFLKKTRYEVRTIMAKEMGLRWNGSRFSFKDFTYPLHVVCFEKTGVLGYFDCERYYLGINRSLIYQKDFTLLRDIIRHELAHLMTFLTSNQNDISHGRAFRDTCRLYGWGKEVWGAQRGQKEEKESETMTKKQEKIVKRIKKLLALSQSNNVHEAQSATLKANELLVKHHLKSIHDDVYEEEEDALLCVDKILSFKRATKKYQAIARILDTFYVYTVFNYHRNKVVLEATGLRENISIAKYVAGFLDREFERLYLKSGLKGVRQKNSFMSGIALGYEEKQSTSKNNLNPRDIQALAVIKKNIHQSAKKIYGYLSSRSSSSLSDTRAKRLGMQAGKNLSIHGAVHHQGSSVAQQTILLG